MTACLVELAEAVGALSTVRRELAALLDVQTAAAARVYEGAVHTTQRELARALETEIGRAHV